MQQVVPALRITDYRRSKTFYVDGLGFAVEWEHRFEPHLPVFAQVTREGMTIFLTAHTGDCPVGGLVHFYVPDVDACCAEFESRGVAIPHPPSEDIPGLRDMTILDPDGNKLRFCQRLEDWQRTPPA
jgi:catechol 2,3-dioxygenase-like lactoylglutathione lyase family enzyme